LRAWKSVLIVAVVVVGLATVVVQVARRNAALPEGEHLAVALRIQPASPWYRSAMASKIALEDAKSPTWCDLQLLRSNGIDSVTIPGAKLVYLLQLHEGQAAGSFETLDQSLLRELIDVGIQRCDLDLQPEPPEEFRQLVGPHRALVYASMSGDKALYNKLLEQGASTRFDVPSKSGRSVPFARFHETLHGK
jgi:hypothetical protein